MQHFGGSVVDRLRANGLRVHSFGVSGFGVGV